MGDVDRACGRPLALEHRVRNADKGTPSSMVRGAVPVSIARQLAWYFNRNGYVRRPRPERRADAVAQIYKKGYEVRLTANSRAELVRIRRLLRAAGFKPGRPFRKALQFRQPIYGRAEVARFLKLIGQPADA